MYYPCRKSIHIYGRVILAFRKSIHIYGRVISAFRKAIHIYGRVIFTFQNPYTYMVASYSRFRNPYIYMVRVFSRYGLKNPHSSGPHHVRVSIYNNPHQWFVSRPRCDWTCVTNRFFFYLSDMLNADISLRHVNANLEPDRLLS
jgi:hypothetical protein